MPIKGRQRYQKCVAAMLILLVLVMSYIALKEYDTTFSAVSSVAGYLEEPQTADGYTILAVGMEQDVLYPQTYELTIDARTESNAVYFQVWDRRSHILLAEHAYTPGEEYHSVRFTIDRICQDVVVRSVYNESASESDALSDANAKTQTTGQGSVLRIYGYTLHSDGKVGCDARWDICLWALLIAIILFGAYRAFYKGEFAILFL